MDEQHAVLGIHRAIDELATRDERARAAAATLFPVYGAGGHGWSDRFARMLVEHGQVESVDDVFPSLRESLEVLSERAPSHPWEGVRRLQTISAITRVSDAHAPDGEHASLVLRTLEPLRSLEPVAPPEPLRSADPPPDRPPLEATDEVTDDVSDDVSVADLGAERVHELLADPRSLNHEDWDRDVRRLVEVGAIHPAYAVRSGPSCQGEIIPVSVAGEKEPVTLLTTRFTSPSHTVADLDALLDPSRWPTCPGFWCSMDEDAPPAGGVRRFVEVVASDCGGSWRITTRLDFARRDWDDGSASLEYWLCDDQSNPCDGMVVVDEGSILVTPTDPAGGPGVEVTSTKRIRFIEPMDGAQLAATSCALGWADAGERFAFGCSAPVA